MATFGIEKLENPDGAAEAFTESLDIEPDNHVVLHKLLVAFQAAERWSEAIDIIERVCGLEERDEAKAKYTYTIGVVLRDKLEDEDAALERFNEALDLDSTQLKPFEAVNKLLNERKDWKALEPSVPQDASPHHQSGQHGPRAQPLAHARHHLSGPSAQLRCGGGVVQDGGGAQA